MLCLLAVRPDFKQILQPFEKPLSKVSKPYFVICIAASSLFSKLLYSIFFVFFYQYFVLVMLIRGIMCGGIHGFVANAKSYNTV